LEKKLWEIRLDGDGNPVLYVNSDPEVGMLARMRGDPIFQALILPQAVEQVLFHLRQFPGEEEGWKGDWNKYLVVRGIEYPDDPTDDEACAAWARSVAQKFANEHDLLTRLRRALREGHHDS
jgi:hypothetical protein